MIPERVLITADAVGGVWQYATDLARALGERGVETVLALMGPAPCWEQRRMAEAIPGVTLAWTGLELDWLARDPHSVARAGRRIAELAAECGASVAHLNMPALAADARFSMPVVAVAHSCLSTWWAAVRGGDLPPDFGWRDELTRRGLRKADRVVAPTRAFAEATFRAHRLPAPPAVVHNGRRPLKLAEAPLRDYAFTAGRLWDEGKNVATLDRAAGRTRLPIRAAGPLVGPKGQRVRIDRLQCLGALGERALGEQLAHRPIFVSAARYEPFGLAVLEAAQAGCALVLSDIPGFRELWGDAAVLVRAGDCAAFARAIDAIADDPSVRLALGEAARRRARRHTPAAMAEGMLAVYGEVLAKSAAKEAA